MSALLLSDISKILLRYIVCQEAWRVGRDSDRSDQPPTHRRINLAPGVGPHPAQPGRDDAPPQGLPWDFLNAYFFVALVVYGAATLLWVWLLKTLPLNVAYPFVGLAFLIVPLLAAFFLQEPLDWRHLAGGLLIASGVALSSWR